METGERLRLLIENLGITQRGFAELINAKEQNISKYIKNKAVISYNFANNIKKYLPKFNVEWLVNGNGSMFEEEKNNLPANNKYKHIKRLPIYDNIPCGLPATIFRDVQEVEYIEISGLTGLPEPFGMKARGDSNFPEIKDGDKVIAYRIEKPKKGDIIATNFKATPDTLNTNIKVFQPVVGNKEQFLLKPMNNLYDTTVHDYDEVHSFYKCKRLIRDFN